MNCKPGDMAIVIKSLEGRHIGAVVTVVRGGFGGLWEVHSERPLSCRNQFGEVQQLHDFISPDAWLRPISGIPDNESIEQQQPEVA